MNVQQQRSAQSAITLANALEIAHRAITQIAGNDIANSIQGNQLTSQSLKTLIASEFRTQLNKKGATV